MVDDGRGGPPRRVTVPSIASGSDDVGGIYSGNVYGTQYKA